jgi:hypothetical protein
MKVRPRKCRTCPFRDGSPYAELRDQLTVSAMSEGTRECHQTGRNTIGGNTGKPAMACAGARQIALKWMCALKFLPEPTERAWAAKCAELGIENGLA